MSNDANYILSYDYGCSCEEDDQFPINPRLQDQRYLFDKYGGEFTTFDFGHTLCWDKPKYELPHEELALLHATQVLERADSRGERWAIIKEQE